MMSLHPPQSTSSSTYYRPLVKCFGCIMGKSILSSRNPTFLVEIIGEVLQSGRIEDVEVWRVEAVEPFYNNVVFCSLLSAVGGPQFTYKILTVNNYNDKLL